MTSALSLLVGGAEVEGSSRSTLLSMELVSEVDLSVSYYDYIKIT